MIIIIIRQLHFSLGSRTQAEVQLIITKLIIYLGPDLPSVQSETQAIAPIENPVLESVREPASLSQAIGLASAWDRLALCVFWVGRPSKVNKLPITYNLSVICTLL